MTVTAAPSSQAELASLREAVHDVCTDAGGTALARTVGDGWHAPTWTVLAEQIGLAGLGLPESAGGLGGLAEVAVVCEELGRQLLPVPFLASTVLAGQVLRGCGPPAQDALSALAAGQVHALAVVGADGVWSADAVQVAARPGADGWLLDGGARFVLDGNGAAFFVVAARCGQDVDLFLVAADAVTVRPMTTLDLSRAQAEVTFWSASARRLTDGGRGAEVVTAALDVALVALAAEQLGGAQASLDMTVDYVRVRRQFGREIGSFQAIKHRCADMLARVEFCRSAVARAVEAEHDPAALAEAAAVAKAWCSEAFVEIAADTVHLHGGIGFTWEHDAHLYFRRARADAVLFGTAAYHRERLAQLLQW